MLKEFLLETDPSSYYLVKILTQHLLVVKCDVWSPDPRRVDSNACDVAVFARLPPQRRVIPVLQQVRKQVYKLTGANPMQNY